MVIKSGCVLRDRSILVVVRVISFVLIGLMAIDVSAADLTIDAGASGVPWSRYYEEAVGMCHPITILSSVYGRNIQNALDMAINEAGFKRVRGHGILKTDIGLYSEPGGVPTYNWTTFDQVYDVLMAKGIRPIVELSFMPNDLASSSQFCHFWYNGHPGNKTPPRDHSRWRDIVRNIVQHCQSRYGVEEVRNNWYFEVWNEPDLEIFWAPAAGGGTPGMNAYCQLYDYAADGVKQADPLVRIGGPSTTAAKSWDWYHYFLNHIYNEPSHATGQVGQTKLDFLSYHRYSEEPGRHNIPMGLYSTPWTMRDYHKEIVDIGRSFGFQGEYMCTEWAASVRIPDERHSDAESAASFIVKSIHMLSDMPGYDPPDVYSFWCISDIFEEWDARPRTAFDGAFGMLTRGEPAIPDSYDVPKPAFNAFRLLHKMSDTVLPVTGGTDGNGVNAAATITSGEDAVQVLVYHHVDGGEADSNQGQTVNLTISNIPFAPGAVKVEHYVIDRNRSNGYRKWQQLGSSQKPDAGQWVQIRQAAELAFNEPPYEVTLTGSSFNKTFESKVYSVSLIVLTSLLPPPTNLQAAATSGGEVQLTWEDNTHGDQQETGFLIERRPYYQDDQWHQVGTAPADTTAYTDTDSLFGLVEYTYRVGAYR